MFALARKNVLWAAVVLDVAVIGRCRRRGLSGADGGMALRGASAVAVDADRDLVYSGSGGVILVLDVADPAMPQLLHDGLHTDGHVRDLGYVGADKRLYVADWRGGLEIWDVQDPQNPVRLSTVPVYCIGTDSDQPTDGLVLAGGYLYVNANEARVHASTSLIPPIPSIWACRPVRCGTTPTSATRTMLPLRVATSTSWAAASPSISSAADGTLDKVGENTYIDKISCIEVQGSYAYAGESINPGGHRCQFLLPKYGGERRRVRGSE